MLSYQYQKSKAGTALSHNRRIKVMTLSATFPNERKIMDAIAEYRAQTRPEIIQLIEESKPLPPSTEILNRFNGKWERISITALEAANRRGLYSIDPCAWHYSWRDIWSRMRIES